MVKAVEGEEVRVCGSLRLLYFRGATNQMQLGI
jgi:hypothetical protein